MTPSEALLWEQLRANRLHGVKFRRQQIIDGFIVDFYCQSAQLVIEVDGTIHLSQQAHDEGRNAILAKRNLWVLRFTNDDVEKNMQSVLQKIEAVIALPIRNNVNV